MHKSKPWFEENGTLLIYGLAAILAVAAVVVYLKRKPTGDIEASRELQAAVTPEDYRDIADAHPATAIGIWARLRQAERLMDNGVSNLFTNREVGVEELDQAKTAFDRLADRSDIDEQVRERVLIGLARLAEATCDGESDAVDAAKAAWQKVLDSYPDSLMKDHAEERIADIDTKQAKSFYAWFSKQNPKPIDPGLSPDQPAVPALPDMPAPDFGSLIPEDGAAEAEPLDSKPATTEPGEEKADGEKPAEAKPETPAETTKEEEAAKAEPEVKSDAKTEPKADAADEPAASDKPEAGSDAPTEEPAPEKAAEGGGDADPKPEGEGK
jgi:predicted negative regulator of RcsB-dependent stress response